MKKTNTIFTLMCILLLGCGQKDVLEEPELQTVFPQVDEELDNVWVLSSEWMGYMGVAIGLSSENYYYWFYSDVYDPEEPDYPLKGKYTYQDDELILKGNEGLLYSSEWKTTELEGRKALWAIRDIGDTSRILLPDPKFDATDPFKHQGLLKAEQAP